MDVDSLYLCVALLLQTNSFISSCSALYITTTNTTIYVVSGLLLMIVSMCIYNMNDGVGSDKLCINAQVTVKTYFHCY